MIKNRALIKFINAALFDKTYSEVLSLSEEQGLFSVAKSNAVANMVLYGMQRIGVSSTAPILEMFEHEKDKSLFTYLMQSQQVLALSNLFETAQIPFILLKGSRMRDFYPSPELRTSGDIDILIQADRDTVIRLMEARGFTFSKDSDNPLSFRLGAAVEVELHISLFDEKLSFHGYFDSIWDRVTLKDGWKYQYMMTEEDFFVNMIAHFAKHFSRYGCGIRNAIDIAVYLKNAPKDFDLDRAEAILKEIDLYPFEQKILQLIRAWESDTWTEEENTLTDYILGCGLFGNKQTTVAHSISASDEKFATNKKLFSHIFPSIYIMSGMYPVLKKCPLLLPFCWVARGFRLVFFNHDRIRTMLRIYSRLNHGTLEETNSIIRLMHLENVNNKD